MIFLCYLFVCCFFFSPGQREPTSHGKVERWKSFLNEEGERLLRRRYIKEGPRPKLGPLLYMPLASDPRADRRAGRWQHVYRRPETRAFTTRTNKLAGGRKRAKCNGLSPGLMPLLKYQQVILTPRPVIEELECAPFRFTEPGVNDDDNHDARRLNSSLANSRL